MAEQPIKHSEIIEPGNPFEQAEQGVKEFLKYLNKLEAALKGGVAKELQSLKKANIATKQGRDEVVKAGTAVDEYGRKLAAVNKLKQKATQVSDDLLKSEIRLKEAAKQRLKTLQDQVKSEGLAANSVERMRIKMNQLTREYDRADAAMRKKLLPRIQNYQKHIQKAEQATGRFQRQVGNYKTAFGNAAQSLKSFALGMVGVTALVSAGMRLMRNAVSTVLNFDQAMADVGAISRATAEDMSMLRESAKALGGSTKFTAVEVAGLQKVLAKLGFTTEEILKSTNAILGLAAATGEDLAKSAEVAGSVLRAFNLDSAQMVRVVDVMTASFSGSALDLEKFAVSMRGVAPVANAFGFSIEETTALLGNLVNAGFDASMAGTSLRNILLNLANTNGKLAKELGGTVNTFDEFIPALIKLRDKGVDLNRTLELTDKRSVAAFNRFLQGAEFTRKFREELEKAQGTADEMSKKQLDTLKGDLVILKSAWDGLTIATKDGGVVNESARGIIHGLTKAFQGLSPEMDKNITFSEKMANTEKRLFFDVMLGGIGVLKELGVTIFGIRKKHEELNPIIEETTTRESELADQLDRMARVKSRNEILAEEEIKNNEKLLEQARERVKEYNKEVEIQSTLDDMWKKAFENKKEIIDESQEIDWSILPDETEEEKKADNILNIHQKVTNQSIAQAEQEKQAKIQNEQEAEAFREDSMQRGLAGLGNLIIVQQQQRLQDLESKKQAQIKAGTFDKEAHEKELAELERTSVARGIILNAQLLADQVRALSATIIALGVGQANTAKVGFPQNIPLLIGFAGQIAGLYSTLKSVKIGATKYAEGGSGKIGDSGITLSGKRHTEGGINLGNIEAEDKEYFGIINRPMTQKYRNDLPEVFETLNKGTFHNVWTRANELHSTVTSINQDPYTKKMYNLMKNQPAVYADSDGNQVLLWPTGKKRVIRA